MVRHLWVTDVLVMVLWSIGGRVGALLRIVVVIGALRRSDGLSSRTTVGLKDILGGVQMLRRPANLNDAFRTTRSRILELEPRSGNLDMKKRI